MYNKTVERVKKIASGNKLFIAMVLGFLVGLLLNFYVSNPLIKNYILTDTIFYLGGNGFVKLVKMFVIPLVFFSIVVGVSSISDVRRIGSIGGRTIFFFILTTALGVCIALSMTKALNPGAALTMTVTQINATENVTVAQNILNLIPDNIFDSLANGDMLPIVIFGLLIGMILASLKDETDIINHFFEQGNKVMMEMIRIVMKYAPVAIFCLMARTFATLGFSGLIPLLEFIISVILVLTIQLLIVYPILLILFTRLNPITFYRRFIPVMFFAFSSSSSNATIPLNLEKTTELGVSPDISSFTIPLGATINMDGTAIMQGCTVMFAAQAYGIDFGTTAFLTVLITTVIASIGTAGVPSVGLITLSMVFNSIALPTDIISIIIGIDHILDMFRTAVNVASDGICSLIVAYRTENLDHDVYTGKRVIEDAWDEIY